ncbi:MAG: host-nuclease inhibitor Gam family protein [Verrucomicrobiales bacterium]
MTLKTEKQLRELADEYATLAVEINEIEAVQATEANDLKKRYKDKLDEPRKAASSLKRRMKNFVIKNALRLFNGNGSGTIKTNQAEIRLRNNPPSIKPIDPKLTEDERIATAKKAGYRSVIVEREVISKEALERLNDDELERLGYYRASSQTFDVFPLAKKA